MMDSILDGKVDPYFLHLVLFDIGDARKFIFIHVEEFNFEINNIRSSRYFILKVSTILN